MDLIAIYVVPLGEITSGVIRISIQCDAFLHVFDEQRLGAHEVQRMENKEKDRRGMQEECE